VNFPVNESETNPVRVHVPVRTADPALGANRTGRRRRPELPNTPDIPAFPGPSDLPERFRDTVRLRSGTIVQGVSPDQFKRFMRGETEEPDPGTSNHPAPSTRH
jgi:hypothetical protein